MHIARPRGLKLKHFCSGELIPHYGKKLGICVKNEKNVEAQIPFYPTREVKKHVL